MKIHQVRLKGFNRLKLSQMDDLLITPSSAYQLILGTNGSGKSSVLQSLSPLPVDKADYAAGGLFEIEIHHRGSVYHCGMHMTERHTRYSFKRDGVEFNPGGTSRVQAELCESYLRYSKELHELLTGQLRFTDMSPKERQHWMTMLSSVSFDYAMQLWNQLKSLARDQQGAIRHMEQRLSELQRQLALTPQDSAKYEAEEKHLTEDAYTLLQERNPDVLDIAESQRRVEVIQRQLKIAVEECLRFIPVLLESGIPDKEQIQSLQRELDRQRGRVDVLISQMESWKETVGQTDEIEVEFPDTLDKDIDEVAERLRLIPERTFHVEGDPQHLLSDWRTIHVPLVELFSLLPDNQDGTYSRENERKAKSAHSEILNEVREIDAEITRLRQRIRVIDQTEDTECPSCHHRWKIGVDASQLPAQKDRLNRLIERHAVVDARRKELDDLLLLFDDYRQHWNQYRQWVVSYPRFRSLWDRIHEDQIFTKSPQRAMVLFTQFASSLEQYELKCRLESDLARLTALKEKRAQYKERGHLRSMYAEQTQAIENAQEERHRIERELNRLLGMQRDYEAFQGWIESIETHHASLRQATRDDIEALRTTLVKDALDKTQERLGELKRQLNEHHRISDLIREIESDYKRVKQDHQAYRCLQRAMSPSEGLIADQLGRYVRSVTDAMNVVISRIWRYPMEVLPCLNSDGELNYRFPLKIGTDQHVEDIRYGSKGQQEVINFAFVLTVMRALKMQDYPLYLDELGSGFDAEHRISVLSYIKQCLDTGEFSQLWMISHHLEEWNLFNQGEFLVLDSTNIATPMHYNTHIRLAA